MQQHGVHLTGSFAAGMHDGGVDFACERINTFSWISLLSIPIITLLTISVCNRDTFSGPIQTEQTHEKT